MPISLSAWHNIWHTEYLYAFAFIIIGLLLLLRCKQDWLAIVKSVVVFLAIALICACASFISYQLNLNLAARILQEMSVILTGILTIRVMGLSIFRSILPL
ncbi:MAG TPA: hypothetical protein PKL69_14505, partial [Agitococcus sp.]|nr:hypothetical protein [Agitococcus sp.]